MAQVRLRGSKTLSALTQPSSISIRFTLTLEDGVSVFDSVAGDRFHYTPGAKQILPALEEALRGAAAGDRRRFVLSPTEDPGLKLDVTRLARVLGHPGETLILEVEVL